MAYNKILWATSGQPVLTWALPRNDTVLDPQPHTDAATAPVQHIQIYAMREATVPVALVFGSDTSTAPLLPMLAEGISKFASNTHCLANHWPRSRASETAGPRPHPARSNPSKASHPITPERLRRVHTCGGVCHALLSPGSHHLLSCPIVRRRWPRATATAAARRRRRRCQLPQ